MAETAEEARLTQIMMRRSDRRILLADHTKVGRKGYAAFGNLTDFSEWITSFGAAGPKDTAQAFSGMTRITYI